MAIALTSCVCGRLQSRYAHAAPAAPAPATAAPPPASAQSTAPYSATRASTPAANTDRPSGDAVSASTSAWCCWKRPSSVPNAPSQNCTAPSESPVTTVPSRSTSSAHTRGGPPPPPPPTVSRDSSWPDAASIRCTAPSTPPAASVAPLGCQHTDSRRPCKGASERSSTHPGSPPSTPNSRTAPSSHAAASACGKPARAPGWARKVGGGDGWGRGVLGEDVWEGAGGGGRLKESKCPSAIARRHKRTWKLADKCGHECVEARSQVWISQPSVDVSAGKPARVRKGVRQRGRKTEKVKTKWVKDRGSVWQTGRKTEREKGTYFMN
eukprot:294180-Chlamydomonas_euryale.AAC.1